MDIDEESVQFFNIDQPETDINFREPLSSSNDSANKSHLFVRHYDDFKTIDWLKDRLLNMQKFKYSTHINKLNGIRSNFKVVLGRLQIFYLLIMIGTIGALSAINVSIGVNIFSDLREGICTTNMLLTQRECCWQYTYGDVKCQHWKHWSEVFRVDSNNSFSSFINGCIYVGISVLLATTSGMLVYELAPYASGGGISEIKTILSGFVMRGFLGFQTYIVKAASLVLSASSGLMLGQEGPMVHILCCISNMFVRLFPHYHSSEINKRQILLAGSAGGVALAFNSPIAGVLFSLEETSFYFTRESLWQCFFLSLVGAFVLSTLGPYNSQSIILYNVAKADWSVFELPLFAFLGIIGGLYGALFTKLTIIWNNLKSRTGLGKHPYIEIALVAFLTSVLSFPFHFSRMSNHHLVRRMYKSCFYRNATSLSPCQQALDTVQYINPYDENSSIFILQEIKGILVTLVIKMIFLIFTFGLKLPCGIFVPAILLGALFGRMIGLSVEYASINYPYIVFFKNICSASRRCIYPSLYAVVGSAAFMGGITQMTICIVIMMVEITGKLNYILPLILSVMFSKWVSNALLKRGIHEEMSVIKNYPYLSNKEDMNLTLSVEQALSIITKNQLITFPTNGILISEIENIIKLHPFSGFPVVTTNNILHGFIESKDLTAIIDDKHQLLDSDTFQNHVVYFEAPRSFPISQQTQRQSYCDLRRLVDKNPILVHPKAPLNSVTYIFQKLGVHHVLVVEKGNPIGIITRKDIINLLNRMHKS